MEIQYMHVLYFHILMIKINKNDKRFNTREQRCVLVSSTGAAAKTVSL